VAELARERGDAAHEGAGDAEHVQFDAFKARPGSSVSRLP
jgi:hypothetical protein